MIIPHLATIQPEDRLMESFVGRVIRGYTPFRQAGVSGVEISESFSEVNALPKGIFVFKSEIKKIFFKEDE